MEQTAIVNRVQRIMEPLVGRSDTLIVAVSGGMDSMALLRMLPSCTHATIVVAHLDHGLRTDSSDVADFVSKFASHLGLVSVAERVELRGMRGATSSLEATAREVRYDFLRRVKAEHNASWIVTAHTSDDQAETMLMHFVRGSGVNGLSGMAIVAGDILRPLLTSSREEIEQYVQENNVPYRHDSTNDDMAFTRNVIRHQVLPPLKRFNASLSKNLTASSDIYRDIQSYLSGCAEEWIREHVHAYQLDRTSFDSLHRALQREVILKLYEDLYGGRTDCDSALVDRAREWIVTGSTGTTLRFGSEYTAFLDYQQITFERSEVGSNTHACVNLSVPGVTAWGEYSIRAEKTDRFVYNRFVAVLDMRSVPDELMVRAVRPGDRFVPHGSTGSVKVTDFFTNEKVPRRQRARIPLVVTKDGEVVWVVGHRVSEHYRSLTSNTHSLVLSTI